MNKMTWSFQKQQRQWKYPTPINLKDTTVDKKPDPKGATAIEYGLIAALIAVAVLTALGSLKKEEPVPTTTVEVPPE